MKINNEFKATMENGMADGLVIFLNVSKPAMISIFLINKYAIMLAYCFLSV